MGAPTSAWGSTTSNQVQMDLPGFPQRAGTAFVALVVADPDPGPGSLGWWEVESTTNRGCSPFDQAYMVQVMMQAHRIAAEN